MGNSLKGSWLKPFSSMPGSGLLARSHHQVQNCAMADTYLEPGSCHSMVSPPPSWGGGRLEGYQVTGESPNSGSIQNEWMLLQSNKAVAYFAPKVVAWYFLLLSCSFPSPGPLSSPSHIGSDPFLST